MIHRYQLRGFNIVLDVGSGAVHLFDELSYHLVGTLTPPLPDRVPEALLGQLAAYGAPDEIREAYAEIRSLAEQGELFTDDSYAECADMLGMAPIKAMCLHIAHDCNLRCDYCFASTGDYKGGRALMSREVGLKAIDYLIAHSGNRHNLEVDFFGGEPLMNWEVVEEVVRYARSKEAACNKNFRFTVTTNGLLLDEEKIDFINREMSNVVLSIDGRREVHDKLRVTANGKGSYDLILPKMQQLVAARDRDKDYYVRGTFTKYNLDFANDVLHLREQGFDQISVEPVVSDPELSYAITEEDLPTIYAEYERLADLLIERRRAGDTINFFHFMIDLSQGPCAIKRLRGCGCGNEYVAITPQGDVYPCHQFVGLDGWKMGSVFDGSCDEKIKATFAHTHVLSKPDCSACWAKFYCSGGCSAQNFQREGDIRKPHTIACDLERKRVECAIMIQAALASDPE